MSAVLFNCILDIAFEEWKSKLTSEGIFISLQIPRLTNTRYADEILVYAKSVTELAGMMEKLIIELGRIGLRFNAKKTKILRTSSYDTDAHQEFVEISGDMVQILHLDKWHRYLGRRLSLSGWYTTSRCRVLAIFVYNSLG